MNLSVLNFGYKMDGMRFTLTAQVSHPPPLVVGELLLLLVLSNGIDDIGIYYNNRIEKWRAREKELS